MLKKPPTIVNAGDADDTPTTVGLQKEDMRGDSACMLHDPKTTISFR